MALDAVIGMDEAGLVTAWNRQAEKVFGWRREEVLGKPVAELIIPERYREAHRTGLQRVIETGEYTVLNQRLELPAVRRNGQEFPAELAISPIRVGERLEFSAFLRDLTEVKSAEAARRESEEQFHRIFDLASVGMVRVHPDTAYFVEANRHYQELTGYSLEELRQMTPADLTHPDDRALSREMIGQWLRSEIPEYFNVKRYIRKSGEIIWVQVNASLIRDANEQPIESIAIIQDITQHKRMEDALRENEELLRQAVNVANFGVFEHDHLTDEIHFSRRMRDIWGWAPDEVVTIPRVLEKVVVEDREQIAQAIVRAHDPTGDGRYEVEHRLVLAEGGQRWLRLRAQTEFGEINGRRQPIRTIGACLDITAEKERELQLEALNVELDRRVQQRTAELSTAHEQLRQVHVALAETAAKLAMPVRDKSLERRTYRLSDFKLTDMVDCGAVIRGLSRMGSKSRFSDALVRLLYEHMVDEEQQPVLALVRLFETRPYSQLKPDVRAVAMRQLPAIRPETTCLTLVATAGDRPEWNRVDQSAGHRVIPLPSATAVEQLPMIAQLVRQLGVSVGGLGPANLDALAGSARGVFHIEDAVGSPSVPAQQEFVIPYGIKSVVGFGDQMPDGRLFAVIMFSKVPVSAETAALLGHLAPSARLALLSHVNVPNKIEAQILSLDRLLRSHEQIVAQTESHLHATLHRLEASNQELEHFAYVASHDLQEPLRKIQAFGDLLVQGYSEQLGADGRDYLQRMHRAAERMQLLINDLLTLSRVVRKGQPFVSTNLNDAFRVTLSNLEARIKQQQGTVESETLPTIEADPTQMGQLLQNLIGNGLKYARPSVPPVVTVTAERVDLSGGDNGSQPWWKIEVRDNGIGFDPQYAERIFQPFQRLHGRSAYEGTGIGLTICRRIVDRHRGMIRAEGTPGEGAVFTVLLPERQQRESE
ncbi:MAG: PAS domain S-box protein [Planctomycetaceae bacterium]|nr:PAS domain S-box protein [Planctomycetaceae bacterium]